eukprot:CAMPEP_0204431252 /NCGR_PEP_ID=MMETSP0470-20130426/64478_1 /ASSEMBLY_ACC=CAM_ASM_000385 /TAXON_ID=2969 /ORGANISM="Oxyrrhis marina" /LENGTH=145 /DNA_ID=CAMNT_0051429437 /DNA_START=272 /DNA_END=709 /DNA_ORIENTATION=+
MNDLACPAANSNTPTSFSFASSAAAGALAGATAAPPVAPWPALCLATRGVAGKRPPGTADLGMLSMGGGAKVAAGSSGSSTIGPVFCNAGMVYTDVTNGKAHLTEASPEPPCTCLCTYTPATRSASSVERFTPFTKSIELHPLIN